MKKRAAIFWVLGALLLGNSLPHRFTLPLEAAPADVTGSPNIAVDTYRNIAGTFILWSNGKITNAEGGPTDLGHPYGPPPPEAKIGKQTLEEKRSLGLPRWPSRPFLARTGPIFSLPTAPCKSQPTERPQQATAARRWWRVYSA